MTNSTGNIYMKCVDASSDMISHCLDEMMGMCNTFNRMTSTRKLDSDEAIAKYDRFMTQYHSALQKDIRTLDEHVRYTRMHLYKAKAEDKRDKSDDESDKSGNESDKSGGKKDKKKPK